MYDRAFCGEKHKCSPSEDNNKIMVGNRATITFSKVYLL